MSVGDNIKRLRKSRGMTQQRLADLIGAKNYTTITKWESDKNSPQGKDLIRLSQLFNISVDSLLGLDPEGISRVVNPETPYFYFPETISAGLPLPVDGITENNVEKIHIPDRVMGRWAGGEDIFITHVNGESMNKVIPDQSLIAVKPINVANLKDNDIVVFSNENEYSVKRFYNDKENKRFIFSPESNDKRFISYPVPYSQAINLKIHGKVVVYIVELD